jgi:hypothetical protein
MGRPTTYTKKRIEELAERLTAFFAIETNIWLKAFAVQENIPTEELSRLAKKNKKFNQALKMAKEVQELRLCENGLTAKKNPVFSIFALKNVAGWRDKQDITSGGRSWEDMIKEVNAK